VRRLLRTAAVLIIAVALPLTVSAGASRGPQLNGVPLTSSLNDWRCFYGPGIQVWQDINKGGATMILCGTRGYWRNLGNLGEQLNGGNWNDRISSFETFNTSVGGTHSFHLCNDANDSGTCTQYYSGSVYVANVGSTFNDKITSIFDAILTA
jgi:hypothetical protein